MKSGLLNILLNVYFDHNVDSQRTGHRTHVDSGRCCKLDCARECKPLPMPKYQPQVIRDSNPDFQINPHQDPNVCRIAVVDSLSSIVISPCVMKSADDCMTHAKKSPKILYSTMVMKVEK